MTTEAKMAEWQPIETAPVGTRLLFWWRPIGDNNKYAEAVVIGSLPYPPTGQWWNDQAGRHQDIWHLTHWMPLPEPPVRTLAARESENHHG